MRRLLDGQLAGSQRRTPRCVRRGAHRGGITPGPDHHRAAVAERGARQRPALLLPGNVFGTLIDTLQERGRPLLLLGSSVLIVLVGAVIGRWLGHWSWVRVAPYPSAPATRRGTALLRWLLPALGLWILTLPLIVTGEGSLAVSATWLALLDWLVLSGLIEVLLAMPEAGGGRPGAVRQTQEGRTRGARSWPERALCSAPPPWDTLG